MAKIILWASLVLAFIGGSGLVGNGLSTTVMVIATFGVILKIALDIKKDGKPDQDAIIGAFVLPTMISKINGTFAEKVGGGLTWLWSWASQHMGSWVGTGSSVGLALFAIAMSFFASHKTARAGGR